MLENKWLVSFRPNPEAQLRLFCFPYAGGGPNIFRNWVDILGPEIEVVAIQLPGHGTRIKEATYTRLLPAINALLPNMHPLLDKPLALFGHSAGALLAYELAIKLSDLTKPPIRLFVSASNPPKQQSNDGLHTFNDRDFIQKINSFNGTPKAVFDNQELLDLMLPILRADFALAETYTHAGNIMIESPITVFSGTEDRDNSALDMASWSEFTSGSFASYTFPGDHFFIQLAEAALLARIKGSLLTI